MSSIDSFLRRLVCRLMGHAEDRHDLYAESYHVTVLGCTRCDTLLAAEQHFGQYPLPRE